LVVFARPDGVRSVMMSYFRLACTAFVALAATLRPASGTDITFSGTHPTLPLSASATFSASGSHLVVTLTNPSLNDVDDPTQVLTALYFEINGSLLGLGRTSAVVPASSMLLFPPATPFDPLPNGVGGEWEYREGMTNAPFGQRYALNSAGLGLASTGTSGLFPGANLQGPSSVDGLQYGLTSAVDDPGTGNAAVTGGNALIKNQVVFTLSGLAAGFDPSTRFSNVQWQYGTTRCDTAGSVNHCVPDVPEPRTLVPLALMGVLALVRPHRRRPKQPVR